MTGEAGLVLACHEDEEESHPVQKATHFPGKQPSLLCHLLSEVCEGLAVGLPPSQLKMG